MRNTDYYKLFLFHNTKLNSEGASESTWMEIKSKQLVFS